MSEIKEKYTKTSSFIFPLLEIPKQLFLCNVVNIFNKPILTNRFINAYLVDEVINKYPINEGYVTIHVHNFQDVSFKSFYDTLCSFPNYVEDYEFHGCLVFVFKVSEENMNDYHTLLQVGGGYSQISNNAKKLILANYFFTGSGVTLPLILNKSFALKESWEERLQCSIGEQEVWGMIVLEKETLTKDNLRKYIKNNKILITEGH